MMSEKEKEEIKVYVNGKLMSLEDLTKEYPEITLSRSSGNTKVIETLTKTEKPLNRKDIAKRTGLSTAYARSILKKLVKEEYVLEVSFGSRVLYYLLTQKGLKLSEDITN